MQSDHVQNLLCQISNLLQTERLSPSALQKVSELPGGHLALQLIHAEREAAVWRKFLDLANNSGEMVLAQYGHLLGNLAARLPDTFSTAWVAEDMLKIPQDLEPGMPLHSVATHIGHLLLPELASVNMSFARTSDVAALFPRYHRIVGVLVRAARALLRHEDGNDVVASTFKTSEEFLSPSGLLGRVLAALTDTQPPAQLQQPMPAADLTGNMEFILERAGRLQTSIQMKTSLGASDTGFVKSLYRLLAQLLAMAEAQHTMDSEQESTAATAGQQEMWGVLGDYEYVVCMQLRAQFSPAGDMTSADVRVSAPHQLFMYEGLAPSHFCHGFAMLLEASVLRLLSEEQRAQLNVETLTALLEEEQADMDSQAAADLKMYLGGTAGAHEAVRRKQEAAEGAADAEAEAAQT